MITCHFESNGIIAAPFKSCTKKNLLLAYKYTMQRLNDRSILVDLQILDN